MNEARAVPFYCPFCGEEDLFPAEEAHASWHCRHCTRVFSLRLLGLRRHVEEAPKPALSVVRNETPEPPR
ncbi:MAG: hypothetical protein M3P96_14210 [Actinomycetota bacterium]|nr:hypothetical protein [Actinomycetota bacterium]